MDPDAGSTGSVQTLDPIKDAAPEIPSGGLVSAPIGTFAAIVVAIRSAIRGRPSLPFAGFPARHGRLTYAPIAGIVLLALVMATRYIYHVISDPAALGVWWIGNAALLFLVYTFFKNGRVRPQPTATGRIVAIVPAHEQDDDDLNACVWSILNQRGVVVKEVHVVDDGSTELPVRPFSHSRVRWHRTRHGGGHAAAGYVLDRLQPEDWDFVLIVDGACVLAERSVERQLRAFSRARVTATTGLVIDRDPRRNLLSRISDLNLGALSAISVAGWSSVCLLKTVSDAPVLYRAAIPFQHRRRHLAGGGYADSRRLAMDAALAGAVVGVSNAVAWTSSAAHVPTAYRRRLSWSTSWWRLLRLALTSADSRRGVRCRLFGLAHLAVVPVATGYALTSLATNGWHGVPAATIVLYVALYLLLRYAATALYLIEDPATSRGRKLTTWLLLTPAEAVYHLLFVIPIKYVALIRLCARGRSRWPEHIAAPAEPLMAGPGAVYYSGYLPDGRGS
ncbi:glycosyltransferase [Actinoplanes sp. KI2]|uniref:glycosyltransferase n=1 Tax=Actinoplanes sp. KI2 TaxID=2983315 RepID=UPI0021D5F0DA|nr:glycosyltransferase [Actinoplanes sp. KI2]MCU7722227.1 glycosyltransferase [Actinoplanes sp. KI2]